MKETKIAFLGFSDNYNLERNINVLPCKIQNEFTFVLSEEPSIVVCYWKAKINDLILSYPNSPKLVITTENISPDFVFFDYWVGFDDLIFNDRFFRMPSFLTLFLGINDYLDVFRNNRNNILNIAKGKQYFCDFIYSHEIPFSNIRQNIFVSFSKYKRVESCGTYLNNQENGWSCKYHYGKENGFSEKISFQKKCKFSLIIESTSCDSFITEKIMHAFYCGNIPIYFGTSKIFDYFNGKRFIYAGTLENFDLDSIVKRVIEIDNDEMLYLSILSEPVFNPNFDVNDLLNKYNDFLENIFLNPKFIREKYYAPANLANSFKKMEKFHLFKAFFRRLKFIK